MPSNILTRALAANAAFSAVSGVALVAGAAPLAGWLGIPSWLGVAIGTGLVLFAVSVARVARSPQRRDVRQVIGLDIAWVIGAIVITVGFPHAMSTAGLWALGIVTVAVADFAAFQALGLRRQEVSA
jgi:hypothetical protein